MQTSIEEYNPNTILPNQPLDFIWLELTSRCNLQCVHCYAESSPHPEKKDILVAEDYFAILNSAASLGCRKVQFIGGEPTIVKELPDLIVHAKKLGFEFIEVFTNATRIPDDLLLCFIANDVAVATSFYADSSTIHDSITRKAGSHTDSVNTIKRLVNAGLSLRAGIIVMEENKECVDHTITYLHSLGVENVGIDRVRSFGRGNAITDKDSTIQELCGSCWQGSLCVSPNGNVSPCIMSKSWSVGSLLNAPLDSLVQSKALQDIRARIYQDVWLKQVQDEENLNRGIHKGISGYKCHPDKDESCNPVCNPKCSPSCSPCYPGGKCNPDLYCGPCGPDKKNYSKKVDITII